MNFKQIRALNDLSALNLAEKLKEIDNSLESLRSDINAINAIINAIKPKRGPAPGMAELKKRVENLENAIGRPD